MRLCCEGASKEHFKSVWKEILPQIDTEKLGTKSVNNESTLGFLVSLYRSM